MAGPRALPDSSRRIPQVRLLQREEGLQILEWPIDMKVLVQLFHTSLDLRKEYDEFGKLETKWQYALFSSRS